MPRSERQAFKGLLLAPSDPAFSPVRRVIALAAKEVGIELISPEETPALPIASETLFAEADLIIALVTRPGVNVFYELGWAHAVGKPVVIVTEPHVSVPIHAPRVEYTPSGKGLDQLRTALRSLLTEFTRNPRLFAVFPEPAARRNVLPMIDLERLEPRQYENLCFELLAQMGFRQVEWGKELKEVDVVATLPKKDPDGFEYDELWLISMGQHAPPEALLEMVSDPDYLVHRLLRPPFIDQFRSSLASLGLGGPITLLLILFRTEGSVGLWEHQLKRAEQRLADRRYPLTIRFRKWDRRHLENLIQQYPQVAYKYFSEEGRAQSKFRKTTEELYRDTVALNERLQAANSALKVEREKRVRAERDSVWKEVAFKAAHKLGNPIFALETDLQGIKRRIRDNPDEALEVAEEMGLSIEKAKGIIAQFKSLTRAQEISKRSVDLLPLIQSASRVATENGVEVEVKVQPGAGSTVLCDATRMTECFDELFANALLWLNKQPKRISVLIDNPKKKDLPPDSADTRKYLRIRFEDNGCGVPSEMKKKIFAPFYTTHPDGTGLGLSMVERVVQGHDGVIREVGKPDETAVFEIFLPLKPTK
jgi:signal transduction histidine kinase